MQQRDRQLQRGLATKLHNHPLGMLHLNHVEHVFEGERLEVEPIAGVVVGRHRFRVAVDHHGGEALGLQGEGGVHAAIVELDALADAVWPTAQDHHLAAALGLHLVFGRHHLQLTGRVEPLQRPLVGGVVIRRAGGKLRRTRVDRFEHGVDAENLAVAAHRQLIAASGPSDLAIGEAQLLELQ